MNPLIVSSLFSSTLLLGIAPEINEEINQPNPSEISQIDETQAPSPPPDVIEVYYTDPQTVPDDAAVPTFTPSEQTAADLGIPISVGTSNSPKQEIYGLDSLENLPLSSAKRLITRQRDGETQEYVLSIDPNAIAQNPPATVENLDETLTGVIELISDQQEYDANQQVIIATGNVVMRFANATLLADRLRINVPDRLAVAEGNVILNRGEQTLRGEKFEYYFVQDRGIVFNAYGEIYQKSTARDLSPALPTDVAGFSGLNLSERLSFNQPVQEVTAGSGLQIGVGTSLDPSSAQPTTGFASPLSPTQQGGQVNRVRFQAEEMTFNSQGWDATNVRLTNDPFSPPELEVRAETATYRPIAPLVDELRLSNSRVVLDQKNTFPTQDRLVFDRRDRQPGAFALGFDGEERGGLYVERGFNVIDNEYVRFEVKPQYLIQKAFFPDSFPEANPSNDDVGPFTPSVFGVTWDLEADFDQRTRLFNRFSLASLNVTDAEEQLRTKVGLQRFVGDLSRPHDLRLEYNYRERLFNGSLGFQTVQSSVGTVLVSPVVPIGNSGFNLSYQGSVQYVNAATDRLDLLIEQDKIQNGLLVNNRVNLMRYQGAASINRGFVLWSGTALPATAEEGLKYTPRPVVPYLQLATSVTGVTSYYDSGDTQPSLSGSVSLLGQLGHFSQPYLDYTGFVLTFSQAVIGDTSPFLFDRFVDTQTLTFGITQQIYGPFRLGIQSVRNLELNTEISTDYFVEYSRRTYNVLVRYNPALEIGSINLRISDFNWRGNPGPFEGTGVNPVIQGVPR
ncbi:MAG: DUF3769 domain-containing protein [Microcystaceae cyanobacterium]